MNTIRKVLVIAVSSRRRLPASGPVGSILQMLKGIWWQRFSCPLRFGCKYRRNLQPCSPRDPCALAASFSFCLYCPFPRSWLQPLPKWNLTLLCFIFWPTESLYFVDIPIRDLTSDDKSATSTMKVPMVLPHELLIYLMDAWI